MSKNNNSRPNVTRIAKLHFILVALIVGQTILFDASMLVAPDVVLKRWLAAAGLLTVSVAVWYFAKNKSTSRKQDTWLVLALISADIALASYAVYASRGMASKAVLLFVLPILVASYLMRRSAVYATAALSVAAYTLTCVAYFVLNFNEGYKVELYGEIAFYSAILFIISSAVAGLLPKNR